MGRSPERSYFRNAAHLLELPEQICISGPPSCCVQHHRLANTRLQVLFKTPDAWRVPLSHRLPRRHCSQVALIMDKVASSQMKHLSFFCDHNHQPGWNSDGRLRKLGAQCWLIGLRSSAQFYTAGHQQRRSGSYEPAKKSSPACRRALFHEPALQATPESQRYFEHALVAIQPDNITSSFEDRCAAVATAEVLVHRSPQAGFDVAIQIVRNFPPDLFAVHYHGLAPFSKNSCLLHGPPSPGARRSRSINRARSSRVFTDAVEIPSALAVSSMLNCCISRKTKTSL